MRILAISSYFPPDTVGGYEWAAMEVLSRLENRGHSIRVITGGDGTGSPEAPAHVRRILHRLGRQNSDATLTGKAEVFGAYVLNVRRLRQEIRSFAPDVLYFWSGSGLTPGVITVSDSIGCPVVFHLEDDWILRLRAQHGSGQLAWASRRVRGALAGLPRFDAGRWGFIYVSDSLKRQYEAAGMRPARSAIIHNGVSLHSMPRWWPEEVPDVLTIGYAGRIWPNKGLEPLLDALETYLRTPREESGAIPPCQLRVWGRGDALYEGRLRARTEEEPLAGHVAWEGWRPREEMLSAYRGLDLLVVPSLWEEPFGLVTIEAMAAGVPVLASRRGALPEIVDERSGWLVEPTPEGLAAGLTEALASYRRLADKGRAARERVETHFRWDDKVDRAEAFLEEALRPVG